MVSVLYARRRRVSLNSSRQEQRQAQNTVSDHNVHRHLSRGIIRQGD